MMCKTGQQTGAWAVGEGTTGLLCYCCRKLSLSTHKPSQVTKDSLRNMKICGACLKVRLFFFVEEERERAVQQPLNSAAAS